MGKIKIATLGSEDERLEREKRKVKREEKKKREKAKEPKEKVRISGMKGGQRIKAVGADEEEIEKLAKLAKQSEEVQIPAEEKEKAKKKRQEKTRSKKYQQAVTKIDPSKTYPVKEALSLLREVSLASFDESVELHINTVEKGLRGQVTLPHGTGKSVRVAIADEKSVEEIVASVEKGKIDFDILIAVPQVVGKLARVAKFLGPKGLMPNPKNGTITKEPEKVAKKFEKGEINWKTESQFPIIHQVIGKMSFKNNQLEENYEALIKSIGANKIRKITLKSTMSPGIKIQIT